MLVSALFVRTLSPIAMQNRLIEFQCFFFGCSCVKVFFQRKNVLPVKNWSHSICFSTWTRLSQSSYKKLHEKLFSKLSTNFFFLFAFKLQFFHIIFYSYFNFYTISIQFNLHRKIFRVWRHAKIWFDQLCIFETLFLSE